MSEAPIPVLLTVQSAARNDRGALEDVMQMMMPGELTRRGDNWILHYTETLSDEGDHSTVTHDVRLMLGQRRVVLVRKGPYSMMMVLEKGIRYEDTYHTPYGDMPMAVYPTMVSCSASAEKGSIRLEYQLNLQGGFASMRRMHIEYAANRPC